MIETFNQLTLSENNEALRNVFHQVENNFKAVLRITKVTVKNTDLLPKRGLFQLSRKGGVGTHLLTV